MANSFKNNKIIFSDQKNSEPDFDRKYRTTETTISTESTKKRINYTRIVSFLLEVYKSIKFLQKNQNPYKSLCFNNLKTKRNYINFLALMYLVL